MRLLLLLSLLTPVAANGAEATTPTLRQKLHAKIMESIPPLPPPKPPTEHPTPEVPPTVTMEPVIVSDSKLIRAVTAAIEREEQNRRDERFTALDGGKIYSFGPMQVGSWWSPSEGWTFLRLNKAPTRRQIESAETRVKELQELLRLGESEPRVLELSGTGSTPSRRPGSDR